MRWVWAALRNTVTISDCSKDDESAQSLAAFGGLIQEIQRLILMVASLKTAV
jgi:hypothetical protein